MAILIVGEKPSVSRAISSVVGANATKKGYTEGNGYIVSWCVGHLVGLKFPNDYGNGWNQKWSFSQLPMIPDNWLFQITDSTKAQYNLLKNLMNKDEVTEIICATDADREGECIFRYVYNMAQCRKPVKRLWISSLEESAIRKALSNMKSMSAYDNLFNAGYARARADWLVGMNGSRLFSVRYGGKLNIGRVQTPTLAMIVQRDAEVNGFVKQKYFTADLNCGAFTLSSARIDDEKSADALVSACDGSTVTISSVKREVKTDKAPKLYDLTTLQREANKAFGYTAQQTLDYTQSLYEGKLVTYPRTDSQYLSDDMAQTALEVTKLCDSYFGFGIAHTPDIQKVINNSKVSGHHAIIPTNSISARYITAVDNGYHKSFYDWCLDNNKGDRRMKSGKEGSLKSFNKVQSVSVAVIGWLIWGIAVYWILGGRLSAGVCAIIGAAVSVFLFKLNRQGAAFTCIILPIVLAAIFASR